MPGTFQDFLRQVPPQLIGMLCMSGIMLIGIVVWGIIRRRKPKNVAGEGSQSAYAHTMPSDLTANSIALASDAIDDDIPDLDMLLEMTDTPEPPPPPPVADAAPVSIRQTGLVTVKLASGATVDAAEVLIILRDRQHDRLIVQIGDEAYVGNETTIPTEFRQTFTKTMKELSHIAPVISKGAKPKSNKSTAKPNTTKQSTEDVSNLTLAEQIDHFVQAQRRATGAFAGRSIQIQNSTDGGVAIDVDGQVYASVDDIVDAEVRAFIKACISDWQKQK